MAAPDPEGGEDGGADLSLQTTLDPREVEVPEGPPEDPELPDVLERVSFLGYLTFAGAVPVFCSCKAVRQLLSSQLHLQVHVDVAVSAGVGSPNLLAEARRRSLRAQRRLPQSIAGELLRAYIRFTPREFPLKSAPLMRRLRTVMPFVKWEDCVSVTFRLAGAGDLAAMDFKSRRNVTALWSRDFSIYLEDQMGFPKVQKLALSLAQTAILPICATFSNIQRLKVICLESAFADGALDRLLGSFPMLEALHLVLLPEGLVPLCGPGFVAPFDLRLSLLEETGPQRRRANAFVSAHLFGMPFSWAGTFFRRVMRLQMSELNEESFGRSMESLVEILRGLPHLRRLGTVSSRAACLLDLSRDACRLDEIVLTLELEDVYEFFKMFLSLERERRRSSIRRMAVHLQVSDGVARLKPDAENRILGGWYNIAKLIQDDGWLVFSAGAQQLTETALIQLAWFLPQKFSFDSVDYSGSRLPVSTPLCRRLPHYGIEGVPQPSGTLVAGTMKKARVGGDDLGVSAKCGDDPGSPGSAKSGRKSMGWQAAGAISIMATQSAPLGVARNLSSRPEGGPMSPPLSPTSSNTRRTTLKKTSRKCISIVAAPAGPRGLSWESEELPPPDWLGLQMVEVMEAMAKAEPG